MSYVNFFGHIDRIARKNQIYINAVSNAWLYVKCLIENVIVMNTHLKWCKVINES